MADNQTTSAGVVIPDDAKQKYPKLVEFILQSESMNTEERNYWLQVLPVMTPEQVKELEDILTNEKKKLAAIDEKYSVKKAEEPAIDIEEIEKKRKKAREARRTKEEQNKVTDEKTAEALLEQLESL